MSTGIAKADRGRACVTKLTIVSFVTQTRPLSAFVTQTRPLSSVPYHKM